VPGWTGAEIVAYDQAVAQLAEQGIAVVPVPEWDDPKIRDLRHLRHGEDRLTAETHADCSGRAACVEVGRDWDDDECTANVYEVCTDYQAHGHTDPSDEWRTTTTSSIRKKPVDEMTDDEREQARTQRRLVIGHNKAWKSATAVRRAFLREFLTRKTPPNGTAPFVAGMLANHAHLLGYDGNHLAADLLGQESGTYGPSDALAELIEQADDRRAQVITLALVLAACEANGRDDTWRRDGTTSWHGPYLTYLAANGYTLAEVEEYAASNQTA
jgi:ParB family chromosome partitioning protein